MSSAKRFVIATIILVIVAITVAGVTYHNKSTKALDNVPATSTLPPQTSN